MNAKIIVIEKNIKKSTEKKCHIQRNKPSVIKCDILQNLGKVAEQHQRKKLCQHRRTDSWICDTISVLQSTIRNLLYLLHEQAFLPFQQR